MKSSRNSSFLFLLFIVFLVLRLTGVIDWSWWWVTSPLWLPIALVLGGLSVAVLLGFTAYKVGVSVAGKRWGQTRDGRWPRGAEVDNGAEPVVVEVVGSEVVEPQAESSGPRGLPSAGSALQTAESKPGPERP